MEKPPDTRTGPAPERQPVSKTVASPKATHSQDTKRILDGWERRGWGDTYQAYLDEKHAWKTRGRYDALERRIDRLERRWWA